MIFRHGGWSLWELTEAGKERLMISAYLSGGLKALQPRAVPVQDMSTFELLHTLQDAGWSACTPQKKGMRRAKLAYAGAEPLHIYVSLASEAVSHGYLLALLLHHTHKQPVEPFRTEAYYKHICTGTPWVKKSKSSSTFKIQDGEAKATKPYAVKAKASRAKHTRDPTAGNTGRSGT